MWQWDTGTVCVEKRILLLGCDIQRPISLRGWILARPRRPSSSIEMVRSASNEQSHAMTSNIEETHASQQQEQSMLWKTPPKSSSISTKGSGMMFLPVLLSKSILLPGKSRTYWPHSYDIEILIIEKLTEQFIGVPFFPKLRRDCECEGARTFSESRWLGHFTQRKRIA